MNYQKELEKKLSTIKEQNIKPKLLLHACCAPCSSYCLEYLTEYFDITVLFYNPNISSETEYTKRVNELKRFVRECDKCEGVTVVDMEYDSSEFYEAVQGLENEKEGGVRCFVCYELRQRKACQYAKDNGFDYFTTTLSISPHKNAAKLNEIGAKLEAEYGISYLYSDFKKNNGFKRSIELSNEYNLYRQDFCGCEFSKRQ